VSLTDPADRGGPTSRDQADTFLEKAKDLLSDLLEVKVVTAVGDVSVGITTKGDSTKTTLTTDVALEQNIVTVVKLTDGDVTTVISESLLANAELRAFHTEQVAKSLTVIPENLRALVDIAKSLRRIGSPGGQ
jgi:hypothetical protein